MRHPAGRHSTKLRIQLDPATSGTWWGVGTGIMALHARYLQTAATGLWTTNNKLDGPYVYRARVSCLSPPSRRACQPGTCLRTFCHEIKAPLDHAIHKGIL